MATPKQPVTPADRAAARRYKRLVKRLYKLYAEASRDLGEKANTLLDEWEREHEDVEASLTGDDGTFDERAYRLFRFRTLEMSKRYQELQAAAMSATIRADRIAADWIRQVLPLVWYDDMLYTTYLIDAMTDGAVSLRLIDHVAIARLLDAEPGILPEADEDKIGRYVASRVRKELAAGFARGEDVPTIAKRLQTVTSADRAAAVRNARTAITSARNGARQDVMERATDAGIAIKKRWLASLDDRTRVSHQHVDGEVVDVDDEYSNGLRYPGDPTARREELYNCRCTQIVVDAASGDPPRRDGDGNVIDWTTYERWANGRKRNKS